ncbi:hypothetical protein QBC44DRAFT_73205 [Cladorrhinum sp. PSN332]|nr:hypothetical protein QBC44DRAFT_73205 [Cladorrhinum sp. PSN332]
MQCKRIRSTGLVDAFRIRLPTMSPSKPPSIDALIASRLPQHPRVLRASALGRGTSPHVRCNTTQTAFREGDRTVFLLAACLTTKQMAVITSLLGQTSTCAGLSKVPIVARDSKTSSLLGEISRHHVVGETAGGLNSWTDRRRLYPSTGRRLMALRLQVLGQFCELSHGPYTEPCFSSNRVSVSLIISGCENEATGAGTVRSMLGAASTQQKQDHDDSFQNPIAGSLRRRYTSPHHTTDVSNCEIPGWGKARAEMLCCRLHLSRMREGPALKLRLFYPPNPNAMGISGMVN